LNIADFAKYPTPEEWDSIIEKKRESWNKIKLNEKKQKKYNILDLSQIDQMELDFWINEFNDRAFALANNYVMLRSYYDQGIPDDPYYESPGPKGESVRYFPLFTDEKHYVLHFWFGFYTESFYTRYSAIIDTVYHIINAKYKFGISPGTGFIKKVLNKLKTVDEELYVYLNDLQNNQVFKKFKKLRNDIAHNFSPSQVSSGIKREQKEDGSLVISLGIGDYTTTKEFVDNIDESIDLLADIVEKIRTKIV
jgi:hypothetical protein